MNTDRRIAVMYGGKSTEHEVSIVTALQAIHVLLETNVEVLLIYVAKDGTMYLGDDRFYDHQSYTSLEQLKAWGKPCLLEHRSEKQPRILIQTALGVYRGGPTIDAVFPIFHGLNGEDGSIQGMLSFLNIPCIGSSLSSSALGIDKRIAKMLAENLGCTVVPYTCVYEHAWMSHMDTALKQLGKLVKSCVVKPMHMGSSVGVRVCTTKEEVSDALDVVFGYDTAAIVEEYIPDFVEVNIAVRGRGPYGMSSSEEVHKTDAILSYEDKYTRSSKKGSAKQAGMASVKRTIPANISKNMYTEMMTFSEALAETIGIQGSARIDFMVVGDEYYFTEVNVIPGSLAYYLWEHDGISFAQLISDMIEDALGQSAVLEAKQTTFESNLLSQLAVAGGIKG